MASSLVVTIDVSATTTTAPYVFVDRGLSATGPWKRVGQAPLVSGKGYFYDNTVPFDTPVWYRMSRPTVLPPPDNEEPIDIDGPFSLAGNGNIVISDPSRPWADLEFSLCESPSGLIAAACTPTGPELIWTRFGGRTYASDAGLFPILDAERPADVYARRKDHAGSGSFATKTLAAVTAVKTLFTAGGPLYLRAPDVYGDSDFAFQPGDLEEAFLTDRIDQRQPLRLWTYPYVVVDTPVGPQQGTACANWCAIKSTFPTFAALTATGDTWAEIAAGTTVCP